MKERNVVMNTSKDNLPVKNKISDTDETNKRKESLPLQPQKDEMITVRFWIYFITFCCTRFITWGIIMSFPVLFVAFLEKFQKDRLETSAIGSLQVGLLYMFAVIPGYLIPIYGFKINVICGSLILAIGFI